MLLLYGALISLSVIGAVLMYFSIKEFKQSDEPIILFPALIGWVLLLLVLYIIDIEILGVVY